MAINIEVYLVLIITFINPMLYLEDYHRIRDFIKQKSLLLMDHEKKDHARTGIAINNYRAVVVDGKQYFIIPTNLFKAIIMEGKMIDATLNSPKKFGTGNAKDVIQAIYDLEPWFDLDRFIEILKTEQFCYVVEVIDGKVQDKLLRIDLYRDIKENKGGGFDFIGGIFHCFKHFSYKGSPLSISSEVNDITHPKELITKIIKAFFQGNVRQIDEFTFVSEVDIEEDRTLRLVFYFERNTGVYFIKTAHNI